MPIQLTQIIPDLPRKDVIDFVNHIKPSPLPKITTYENGVETATSRIRRGRVILLNQICGERAEDYDLRKKVQKLYDDTDDVDEFWRLINYLPTPPRYLKCIVHRSRWVNERVLEESLKDTVDLLAFEDGLDYSEEILEFCAIYADTMEVIRGPYGSWHRRYAKQNLRSAFRSTMDRLVEVGSLTSLRRVRIINTVAHFYEIGVPFAHLQVIYPDTPSEEEEEALTYLERRVDYDAIIRKMKDHLSGIEIDDYGHLCPFLDSHCIKL